mgnify:CR=1 FL=1
MPWATPPCTWPSDHRGVHHDAAVVLDHVLQDRDLPGADVDLDDGGVESAGERGLGRRVVAIGLEARLFTGASTGPSRGLTRRSAASDDSVP